MNNEKDPSNGTCGRSHYSTIRPSVIHLALHFIKAVMMCVVVVLAPTLGRQIRCAKCHCVPCLWFSQFSHSCPDMPRFFVCWKYCKNLSSKFSCKRTLKPLTTLWSLGNADIFSHACENPIFPKFASRAIFFNEREI